LIFATGGFAGNFVLSLADHAENGFFHRSEWNPCSLQSTLGRFFPSLFLGHPAQSYSKGAWPSWAIMGCPGFLLHLFADLHCPSRNLFGNVISGPPLFAPLLLPNLAILGFLGLDAYERNQANG
jgi:hypothetical protein